jgi:hypothetical protein
MFALPTAIYNRLILVNCLRNSEIRYQNVQITFKFLRYDQDHMVRNKYVVITTCI